MSGYTRGHARQFLARQRIANGDYDFLTAAESIHLLLTGEWVTVGHIRRGRYAGAFTLCCMTRDYRDEAARRIESSKGSVVMTWSGRKGRHWVMFTVPRQKWAMGERRVSTRSKNAKLMEFCAAGEVGR